MKHLNTGAFGEGFPYTNFHDLNLDWIISIVKEFKDQYPDIIEELNKKINAPVFNPNGDLNQVLTSNGDGTTRWEDIEIAYGPAIQEAVNSWLDEHPEATTTVEDGSITMNKFTDRLTLNVEKTPITNFSFNPHFSYRHPDTVYMYQSACEFDYENDVYLAIGYFVNNTTLSGIMLFKNGVLIANNYGNDYGHLNTITYCPVDNKLYVAPSSGTGTLDEDVFRCDALTLENKETLGIRSGVLQWYDGYFYHWRGGIKTVARCKYEDLGQGIWENIYTIDFDDSTQVVQTFVIINGYCYFHLLHRDTSPEIAKYGGFWIKIYSPENTLIATYSNNVLYEAESMYVYRNQLYLLIDERNIDSETYTTYERATICKLSDITNRIMAVRSINREKIFYGSNNGYGDGSETYKTSSPLACLLSEKTIVDMGETDFLPYQANLASTKQFLGNETNKPKISLIGIRAVNVRFSNINFTGINQQTTIIEAGTVAFDFCTFDLKDIQTNSAGFNIRGATIILSYPVFNADFTTETNPVEIKSLFKYTNSTTCNIIITTDNRIFNLKNAILQNGFRSDRVLITTNAMLSINLGTVNDETLMALSTMTQSPNMTDLVVESGTYDVNKMLSNGITSFATAVTLTNAPTTVGRKTLETRTFGSTNSKSQFLYDSSGSIYFRWGSGVNTLTFDNTGHITTVPSWNSWVTIH